MKIGALNRPVLIESRSGDVDSYGQMVEDWTTFASVWAAIMVPTGNAASRDGVMSGEMAPASSPITIRIRYRTDITAAMRVIDGATTYNIYEVLPNVSTKAFTDLRCGVQNG